MKTSALIKEYREKRNLTQKQLSDMLCYDNPQFISLLENEHNKLPPYMMKSFCKALKIKPEIIKQAMIADYSERLDQYMRDQ